MEPGRVHTEPATYDDHDDNDNTSVFSESFVEREGVTRQTMLILPEAEDDAFFDSMSQGMRGSDMARRQAVRRGSLNDDASVTDESKDVKLSMSVLEVVAARSHLINTGSQNGKEKHSGSMLQKITPDIVHVGYHDAKFTQLFQEGMKNFKI